MKLKIKKATVVLFRHTTDEITLELEGGSTYPEMDAKDPGRYPPSARLSARKGYGLEWVLKTFGREVPIEVVDTVKGSSEMVNGAEAAPPDPFQPWQAVSFTDTYTRSTIVGLVKGSTVKDGVRYYDIYRGQHFDVEQVEESRLRRYDGVGI